jgi:hypothetical protein
MYCTTIFFTTACYVSIYARDFIKEAIIIQTNLNSFQWVKNNCGKKHFGCCHFLHLFPCWRNNNSKFIQKKCLKNGLAIIVHTFLSPSLTSFQFKLLSRQNKVCHAHKHTHTYNMYIFACKQTICTFYKVTKI